MSLSKREELVSELTSFHEFLVGLHLPPDALKRPPPGGWPSINQQQLRYLNKDDDVIDVLKHIPYIRQDEDLEPYQIYEHCVCNDLTGVFFEQYSKEDRDAHITEPIGEEIDSSIVTLARADSRDGWFIFYHTAQHTIEMVDYQVGKRTRDYSVKDFFEMLRDEFRKLKIISVRPSDVQIGSDDDESAQLRDVFWRHGRPSERFQKEKCLTEAKELADRQLDA